MSKLNQNEGEILEAYETGKFKRGEDADELLQRHKGRAAMASERDAYDELCCYTLAHDDPSFIHQHVVDTFAAQDADEHEPIRLTFALVGLYLHVEKGFSGREVQLAHMKIARRKQQWPVFALPDDRGSITASDVLAAPPGSERDRAIHEWCACVWRAFLDSRPKVVSLLEAKGVV